MRDRPAQPQEKERDRIGKAFRRVFGSPDNRGEAESIVLAYIEKRCRIWNNTWIPNKDGVIDPYRSAIAEGERVIGIELIQLANSRPSEEPNKPTVKTNE